MVAVAGWAVEEGASDMEEEFVGELEEWHRGGFEGAGGLFLFGGEGNSRSTFLKRCSV